MRIHYYTETYKTYLHYLMIYSYYSLYILLPFLFFLFHPHTFPHLHFPPTSVLYILSLFSLSISNWSSFPVPEWLLGTLNSSTLKMEATCSSKILVPTYQSKTGYSRRNHVHSHCPKKYNASYITALLNTEYTEFRFKKKLNKS